MGIALGRNGHSPGAKWAYVMGQYGPQQRRLGNGICFCARFMKCILGLSFVLLFRKVLKILPKYVFKIKIKTIQSTKQNLLMMCLLALQWGQMQHHSLTKRHMSKASSHFVPSITVNFAPLESFFFQFFNTLLSRHIVQKYHIFKHISCKTSTHPCDTGLSLFSKWQKSHITKSYFAFFLVFLLLQANKTYMVFILPAYFVPLPILPRFPLCS